MRTPKAYVIHENSTWTQPLACELERLAVPHELWHLDEGMLDLSEPVSREVVADLRQNLGPRLLETPIFRDAQLVEASSHGTSLFDYNLCAKGARQWGNLHIHPAKLTGS